MYYKFISDDVEKNKLNYKEVIHEICNEISKKKISRFDVEIVSPSNDRNVIINFEVNGAEGVKLGINGLRLKTETDDTYQIYSPAKLLRNNDIFDPKVHRSILVYFIYAAASEIFRDLCIKCFHDVNPAVYDFSDYKNTIQATEKLITKKNVKFPFTKADYESIAAVKNNKKISKEVIMAYEIIDSISSHFSAKQENK